jgi:hypothetical protein
MGDAAVARGDGNVAQLHVHVVLGCLKWLALQEGCLGGGLKHTFNQLAAKNLAGRKLERAHVTLRLVQKFDRNSNAAHCYGFGWEE